MVNVVGMKRRKNSSEVSMKETTKILMDILWGICKICGVRDKKMGEFELWKEVVIWLTRGFFGEHVYNYIYVLVYEWRHSLVAYFNLMF